jgi:hypothetical protein
MRTWAGSRREAEKQASGFRREAVTNREFPSS